MRPLALSDALPRLAEALRGAAPVGGPGAAFGVHLLDDGVELHLQAAVDGAFVGDLLLGFDAPTTWDAIGVLTHGRAHDPDRPGPPTPVELVHLQARSGASYSLVGPAHGPVRLLQETAEGRVADLCRRSLGLVNPPPAGSPLRWWACSWLQRLASVPALELAEHEAPLVAAFPGGAPFEAGHSWAGLTRHGELLAETCPWSSVRQAAVAGGLEAGGLAPHEAAWMDDGLFARWVEAESPPPLDALAEVAPRLRPALLRGLVRVLMDWDVLDAAPRR